MKKKKNWFTKNDDNIFFLAWAQNTHGENFHIKPTQYWIY